MSSETPKPPEWFTKLSRAVGHLKDARTELESIRGSFAVKGKEALKERLDELLKLYALEVDDIHRRVAGLKAAEDGSWPST